MEDSVNRHSVECSGTLPDAANEIDTGDHVHHAPSGEDWLVAYVRGDRLVCCGWPESTAYLSDCTLIKKAEPRAMLRLLLQMAESDGSRATYANNRLARMAAPVDVTERSTE